MTVKFKFPAIVFYVDKVQKGQGYVVQGKAMAFCIIIGNAYKLDKGLYTHEYTHVKEWWIRGLLIHNILYGAIRSYRLHSECKAYYRQWLVGEQQTELKKEDFADRIWLFYKLKYDRGYVRKVFYSYF